MPFFVLYAPALSIVAFSPILCLTTSCSRLQLIQVILKCHSPLLPIAGRSCSTVHNPLLPSVWHKKHNAANAATGSAFPFPQLSLPLQQLSEENYQGSFWSLHPPHNPMQKSLLLRLRIVTITAEIWLLKIETELYNKPVFFKRESDSTTFYL